MRGETILENSNEIFSVHCYYYLIIVKMFRETLLSWWSPYLIVKMYSHSSILKNQHSYVLKVTLEAEFLRDDCVHIKYLKEKVKHFYIYE